MSRTTRDDESRALDLMKNTTGSDRIEELKHRMMRGFWPEKVMTSLNADVGEGLNNVLAVYRCRGFSSGLIAYGRSLLVMSLVF